MGMKEIGGKAYADLRKRFTRSRGPWNLRLSQGRRAQRDPEHVGSQPVTLPPAST